jgi:hypothetical protein
MTWFYPLFPGKAWHGGPIGVNVPPACLTWFTLALALTGRYQCMPPAARPRAQPCMDRRLPDISAARW